VRSGIIGLAAACPGAGNFSLIPLRFVGAQKTENAKKQGPENGPKNGHNELQQDCPLHFVVSIFGTVFWSLFWGRDLSWDRNGSGHRSQSHELLLLWRKWSGLQLHRVR